MALLINSLGGDAHTHAQANKQRNFKKPGTCPPYCLFGILHKQAKSLAIMNASGATDVKPEDQAQPLLL